MTATSRESRGAGGPRHAAPAPVPRPRGRHAAPVPVPRPRRSVDPVTRPIPRVAPTTTIPHGETATTAIPLVDTATSAFPVVDTATTAIPVAGVATEAIPARHTAAEPVTDRFPVVAPPAPSLSTRADVVVLAVASGVAVAAPALASASVSLPGRPVLAVLFMLVVPGVPVALFLRLPDRLLSANIALGVSLGANLLVATAVLQAGWWHPVPASWALTAVAIAFAVAVGRRMLATGVAPAVRPAAEPSRVRFRLVTSFVLVVAMTVWAIGVHETDLNAAGLLGVATAVGWKYVVALAMLMSVAAAALLRRQLDAAVLAACTVLVTLALYGFVNIADGQASVATGWLHVGFIHYITDYGHVLASYDARFSWPGFFAAGAQLVALAGVPDARPFLLLSPVVFNLLSLLAVFLIGRSVTSSPRCAWLTVFVVLCTNWYQQDYFAPQAVCYVLYLVVVATLLWSSTQCPTSAVGARGVGRALEIARRVPARPPGVTSGASLGTGATLLVMGAATVVSHQLTPVAVIIALVTFVVCGATRYRSLWIMIVLLMVAWYSYGATDFIFGHLGEVIGDVGQVQNTISSAVTDRLTGNPVYLYAQQTRIGWSGALFGVALLGAWFVRRRRDAVLVVGLAVGPFTLMLLQSYGGEVLIRCFLYAAPFLATLAVVGARGVVHAVRERTGRRRAGDRTASRPVVGVPVIALTAVALTVMSLALTFTRGLNVSFERNPGGLLAGSDFLLDRIPTGAAVGTLRFPGILPYRRLGDYSALSLEERFCGVPEVECAIKDRPEFILVTTTQDRIGELQSALPRGWTITIADELIARGLYTKVFVNRDVEILKITGER